MSASKPMSSALRSIRAARTQLRHSESLHPMTTAASRLVKIHLRELADVEADVCRTLRQVIDDDREKPWKRKKATA